MVVESKFINYMIMQSFTEAYVYMYTASYSYYIYLASYIAMHACR